MDFLDTGNKKHQGQHWQEHLRLLSNNGDYVTFHRLTAYHLFLGSHFDETLASRGARHGSGFSVVSVQFKVWALLVQWVRRLATGLPVWARFFEYHTGVHLGSSPLDVLSRPTV